jgi:hypothetical protein
MNKLQKVLKASLLCIKYPFLYPRNRWDDRHHTYLLSNYTSRLHKKSTLNIGITGKLEKDNSKKFSTIDSAFDLTVKLSDDKTKAIIRNGSEIKEYEISKVIWGDKFKVIGVTIEFALTGRPIIMFHVNTKDSTDNTNYGFFYDDLEFITNKRTYNWYKFVSWFDKEILDRILFLPKYTELDAMPEGWRKAFGLNICKEIKQELKKYKGALKKYRITQIKEKFGGLEWYDWGSTEKMYKEIKPKYRSLSKQTCIICGNPATCISNGWVSPYCDNCKDDKHNYTKITEENAWDKALSGNL